MKLIDFEEEKGYVPLKPTRENIKANVGKKVCYVDFVEPYRGTYFVRYGKIKSCKRWKMVLEDEREVDIIKIKDFGIENGEL